MKRPAADYIASLLLRCYPPAFRRQVGGEILQFVRTASASGARGVVWAVVRDSLRSLPREWHAALVSGGSSSALAPERRPGEPMRNLFRDFTLAGRLLARSPAFTIAAVVTLALGIGANTAMFTLADASLLRPIHVHDPERLVVWSWTSAYPDYQEYSKRTDLFEGVLAVAGTGRVNLAIDGAAELTPSSFVSGNAFDVLGVRAAHGRTLLPSDDVANGPLVAVLGNDYWRSRFGGNPAAVGRTVRVNGRSAVIVGVAEEGFRGTSVGSNPSIYFPTGVYNQVQTGFFSRMNALATRGFVWLNVIARLRPDAPVSQAETAMTDLYAQLHPRTDSKPRERLTLTPLPTRALGRNAGEVRNFVVLLLGVVGLTLLIGCANLANLLLARAEARRREIGVRLALGATRGRIVQQMLAESVLLAAIGGAAAIGVAAAALGALSKFQLPGGIAIESMRLQVNGTALAVASGLSLATGLLFGVVPALRASRTNALTSLRDQGRGATSGSGVRNALLGAQVALSLVLLTGAGLFIRGLSSALEVPLGFDERKVLTASVNLGLARYDEVRAKAFFETALERVRALPQVESAGWGNLIPTRGAMTSQTEIEGYAKAPDEDVTIHGAHVGPGYLNTVGTRLKAGREVTEEDRPAAPPVAMINERMAEKYWAGRNPIGGRFQMFDQWITVVGVVENAIVRELTEAPVPHVYLAFNQWLSGREGIATDPAHLFIRTRIDPAAAVPLVREQLRAVDPEVPMYDVVPFADRVAALVMPQRMGVALFTLFSALALALATVGIYGVATYVASRRTREIGIRIALGATTGAVRRLVLVQGARPIVIGILAGLAMAIYASRLAEAFLLNVSPLDPLTFATVPLTIGAIALVASYVPARRASRIEPVQALRDE